MTWVKIDDQLHSHPKVLRAWHSHRAALGLHLLALSHAAGYLTDGHVSEGFVKSHLPGAAGKRAVAALLDAGLWEENGSGWVIHDYLAFNESREQVLARRSELAAVRSEAGRKGAHGRWRNRSSTDGKQIAPAANGKPMAPTPDPFPTLRPSVAERSI